MDWRFDGDDLIYVVRTAHRSARNFHDSNRILFSREPAFRALLAPRAAPPAPLSAHPLLWPDRIVPMRSVPDTGSPGAFGADCRRPPAAIR